MLFSNLASFVVLAVATTVAAAANLAARVAPDRPRHGNGCVFKTDFEKKTDPNPWDNQPLKINTTHWPSTNVPHANLTGGDVGVYLYKADTVNNLPLDWYVNATGVNNTYKIIVPYSDTPGDYLLGYVMDPQYHPLGYDGLFDLVGYVRGNTFMGKMPESWNSDRWIFKTEGDNTYLGIDEVWGDDCRPLSNSHGYRWYANMYTWCPPGLGQGQCDGMNFLFGGQGEDTKYGRKLRIKVECPPGVKFDSPPRSNDP